MPLIPHTVHQGYTVSVPGRFAATLTLLAGLLIFCLPATVLGARGWILWVITLLSLVVLVLLRPRDR